MEKRLFLAMLLSLLILLGFQVLFPGTNKQGHKMAREQGVYPGKALNQGEKEELFDDKYVDTTYSGADAEAGKTYDEETIEIQTEMQRFLFSNRGGSLKELSIKQSNTGQNETIIEEEEAAKYIFAMRSEFVPGLERNKFEATKGKDFLEYKLHEPEKMEITKKYTFHNSLDYLVLDVIITNVSSQKISFSYDILGPSYLKPADQAEKQKFAEVVTKIGDKLWKTRKVKGIEEKTGDIFWVALKEKYSALILKNFSPIKAVTITMDRGNSFQTVLNCPKYILNPGESISNQYLMYAGPLDEKRIARVGYDMQEVIDYGFFGGVSEIILSTLRFFYRITRNWGAAIIFLTLLINMILFPLTFKSFSAMQQMKNIQPHIQKLKSLHKDNPQKLNKEIMELYKKYKVNPLGGCLPMVLQMPIFIALYQGLMRSIELKGAVFLWMRDLSRPDAVPLPMALPLIGTTINILPLLMVGVMLAQQKLSQGMSSGAMTDEQASQQKMMLIFMPLMFGFLFYNMPSGLVLYWLTNTVLMTLEQMFINKRLNKA